MTTRLSLYNGALLHCGERDLAALTDDEESRRLLDRVWDNGAVDYCLGQGQWSFARRSRQLAPDTGIDPGFGYSKAYEVPSDLVRTVGVWSDEYCNSPLLTYIVEGGYWYSDTEPIYVSYVSNDASYGGDLSVWPAEFVLAVELYLASRIILRLTQSEEKEKAAVAKAAKAFLSASSGDAMENPTKFPPPSSWVKSRVTRGGQERGNRGRLVG